MKFSYLRRLKDGKEFCIPEQDVEGTLKQGFELIKQDEDIVEEKNEVKEEKSESFQCPLCEFQTQFEKALKMHKGRKHK